MQILREHRPLRSALSLAPVVSAEEILQMQRELEGVADPFAETALPGGGDVASQTGDAS